MTAIDLTTTEWERVINALYIAAEDREREAREVLDRIDSGLAAALRRAAAKDRALAEKIEEAS